jgi:hypothetical protein
MVARKRFSQLSATADVWPLLNPWVDEKVRAASPKERKVVVLLFRQLLFGLDHPREQLLLLILQVNRLAPVHWVPMGCFAGDYPLTSGTAFWSILQLETWVKDG